ncbi:hypothetical protein Avbf_05175 [Armadillidium vulgare]|nr:hypothetical protein Avbf_05175 [Armadillidium vulgare]
MNQKLNALSSRSLQAAPFYPAVLKINIADSFLYKGSIAITRMKLVIFKNLIEAHKEKTSARERLHA